ncbi:TPA: entry exclusion lipoprotein TrbK [Klebsiella pneumoniae]|nr:entry exclusion lipoprotein TrbK [Klebsiella pneumoniae]
MCFGVFIGGFITGYQTPKGHAEGQGVAETASSEVSSSAPNGSILNIFSPLPEVNDENCKQSNIKKIENDAMRAEFSSKCFRRGTVQSTGRDKGF